MATRISLRDTEPRKRPRQARSRVMVETILEAAARILETAGLEAVTTNAVSERAGIGIGSLYQYFPGKAAILAELTRRERALFAMRLAEAAGTLEGAPLELAVRGLIDVAVSHQLERPALARALDYVEPSLAMGGETSALSEGIVKTVEGMLRSNDIRRPREAAADLVAMAKGMIDAAGLAGETDAPALSARVCRAALGYLRGARRG